MKIQNVNDAAFSKYGKVVTNVDFAPLVAAINESTPLPDDVALVTIYSLDVLLFVFGTSLLFHVQF